jgi:hypothetical protein
VRPDDCDAVFARLLEAGWTTQPPISRRVATSELAQRSVSLAAPGTRTVRLDLRSRAAPHDPTDEGDAHLWDHASEREFLGARVMLPEARAYLAHVLTSGTVESAAGDIAWSVDAVLLMASFAVELDAVSLAARAGLRCNTLALWDTLRFLRDVLACPGAEPLIAALERNPISSAELIAHQSLLSPSTAAPYRQVAQALVQERIAASREKRDLDPERALVSAPNQPKWRARVRVPTRRS